MNDEKFFTRQVRVLIGLLILLGLGVGFGVRYGKLPERVGIMETRIERFDGVLGALQRQSDYMICKDTNDPVIRRLLGANCATPEARRAEATNGGS